VSHCNAALGKPNGSNGWGTLVNPLHIHINQAMTVLNGCIFLSVVEKYALKMLSHVGSKGAENECKGALSLFHPKRKTTSTSQ
jgi:hypothetical protein